jgi:hypothetical protein
MFHCGTIRLLGMTGGEAYVIVSAQGDRDEYDRRPQQQRERGARR